MVISIRFSIFSTMDVACAYWNVRTPDPKKPVSVSIRGSNVTKPTVFQILTFLLGLVLATVFGWKTAYSSQSVWDATTAAEKVLSAMPTLSGEKDSKWMLQALNWDASSKVYRTPSCGGKILEDILYNRRYSPS